MSEPIPRPRRYSERTGLREPTRLTRQFRNLDQKTRRHLWNAIHLHIDRLNSGTGHYVYKAAIEGLYIEHYDGFHDDLNEGERERTLERLRRDTQDGTAEVVFDALEAWHEAIARCKPQFWDDGGPGPGTSIGAIQAKTLQDAINDVFARELVELRMRDGLIVDIGHEIEGAAVAEFLESDGPFTTAREHLDKAVQLLSVRPDPDLVGAIAQAFHATESAARAIAPNAKTLGAAISTLQGESLDLHPALLKGWKSLYGWASDEGGYRHGNESLATPSPALAHWTVVSAAAFIRYLEAEFQRVKPISGEMAS